MRCGITQLSKTSATAAGLAKATVTMLLAANAEPNYADNEGVTPLFMACQKGHTEVVTKLLAANADVNQAVIEGFTPLIVASH